MNKFGDRILGGTNALNANWASNVNSNDVTNSNNNGARPTIWSKAEGVGAVLPPVRGSKGFYLPRRRLATVSFWRFCITLRKETQRWSRTLHRTVLDLTSNVLPLGRFSPPSPHLLPPSPHVLRGLRNQFSCSWATRSYVFPFVFARCRSSCSP